MAIAPSCFSLGPVPGQTTLPTCVTMTEHTMIGYLLFVISVTKRFFFCHKVWRGEFDER